MPRPTASDHPRSAHASPLAGLRTALDKRWVLAVVGALLLFAVVGGVYLGLGAGAGSPVKQDAAADGASAAVPELDASAQGGLLTGASARGASAAVPAEGGIVAPGGVELQRQDPLPGMGSGAESSGSDALSDAPEEVPSVEGATDGGAAGQQAPEADGQALDAVPAPEPASR